MCGADDSLCFIQIKQSVNIFNYAYYNRCEYVLCTFDWDIFLSTRIDTIYRVINIVQCNMLLKCMVKPRTNPIVAKGFVQCKRSDPKLGECIKNSLQNAIPHLVKGVPSLGLYPIDPLRITALGIDQGTGPVSIKLNFRDLDISNIGTVKVNEVYADLDNYNITLNVDFEKPITLDGNYDIKGKVIILPITGDGLSKIVLENLKAKINVYLMPVVRNGHTYSEVKDVVLSFTTTKMRLKLDNLFKGDKALGNNMNTFLNENWREILGELQSNFESALAAAFSNVAQQFFSRVPYNQVFKD